MNNLESTAKFYARHLLEHIGADNGNKFKNNARQSAPGVYVLNRGVYGANVTMKYDENAGTITTRAYNGYDTAEVTNKVSDYTPPADNAPKWVLAA